MNVAAQTVTTDPQGLPSGSPLTVAPGQAEAPGDFVAAMLAQTPGASKAIPVSLPNAAAAKLPQATAGSLLNAATGTLPKSAFPLNPAMSAFHPRTVSAASFMANPTGSPANGVKGTANAPAAVTAAPVQGTPPLETGDPPSSSCASEVPSVDPAAAADKEVNVDNPALLADAEKTVDAGGGVTPGQPARSAKTYSEKQLRTDGPLTQEKATVANTNVPSLAQVPAAPAAVPNGHTAPVQAAAVPLDVPAPIPDAAPTSLATKPQSRSSNPGVAGSGSPIQSAAGRVVASAGSASDQPQLATDAATPGLAVVAHTRGSSTHPQADEQDDAVVEATPASDTAQPAFSSLASWIHLGPQATQSEGVSFTPSMAANVPLRHDTVAASGNPLSTIAVSSTGTATPMQHVAAPAQRLEVAVNDPVLGHVDVRAEMRGGALYASIAGQGSGVASAMPAMHQFLQEHQVSVHSLAFVSGDNSVGGSNSVSASTAKNIGSSDTGREAGSGLAGGSGSGQSSQSQSQNQQIATPRSQYASGNYAVNPARQAATTVSVQAVGVSPSGTVSIHI